MGILKKTQKYTKRISIHICAFLVSERKDVIKIICIIHLSLTSTDVETVKYDFFYMNLLHK